MKRTSPGLLSNAMNERSNRKTNRSGGSSSSTSSLLVNLLQKDSLGTEMDSGPPEKKRRKYSSQGAGHDDESSPSVTKVANAMMAGHNSENGPSGLSDSERLLAERLALAASAGTTLIPPNSDSSSSGKDRTKGSHNQYGTKQADLDAVSSLSKGNKNVSISRTGNSHLNTQIHSESAIHSENEKKYADVNSASGNTSLSNSMMPPPKSKTSASNLSSNMSNSISSETNRSASGSAAAGSSDKQQRVQHPAIVGGGVGRDNQVQPQPLHTATDLLANKRDQPNLNRVDGTKPRQVLINPNTGMLESGPSESSSEGENDLDGSGHTPTSDKRKGGSVLNSIASGSVRNQSTVIASNAERALKVKLRLSSNPQEVHQHTTDESSSSSSNSLINNAVNSIPSSKIPDLNSISDSKQKLTEPISKTSSTNSSGSERLGTFPETKTKVVEPKLPKLILSMREKKVKLSQESAAAVSNKSQKISTTTNANHNTRVNRKKQRKPTTSEDEGTDSEGIDEDDGGDDYHPTDEEEDEDDVEDEDLDEPDEEDEDEALKIATARAKNLRMMQLHASSSPSRTAVSSKSGTGDSSSNVLDSESSRDNKVQNRTSSLSQANEKHLKSLETSRSKFLRMKQQQRSKKQNMQLSQTLKVDLWKDSLNIRDRNIENVREFIDHDGKISKLHNARNQEKNSQEIETRLLLTSTNVKDNLQMDKGNFYPYICA